MVCIVHGKERAGFTFNTSDTNYVSDVALTIVDDTNYTVTTKIGQEELYSFLSPGIKQIKASIDFDDGWGNVYTYETSINVTVKTYDTPLIDFSWSPFNPTIQDVVTFTPDYVDTRNDATNEYYGKVLEIDFDVLDGTFIDGTILPGDVFVYQFGRKYKNAPVRMIVRYDDGFNIQQVNISNNIQMGNISPVASWSFTDNGGKCVPSYTWSSTSYDLDDTSLSLQWALYIDTNGVFEQIGTSNTNTFTWVFQKEGNYKLTLDATDPDGVTDTYTETFTVTIKECSQNGSQRFIIEWE